MILENKNKKNKTLNIFVLHALHILFSFKNDFGYFHSFLKMILENKKILILFCIAYFLFLKNDFWK